MLERRKWGGRKWRRATGDVVAARGIEGGHEARAGAAVGEVVEKIEVLRGGQGNERCEEGELHRDYGNELMYGIACGFM